MFHLYRVMLFLHVSGDIALFIGLGTQLIVLAAMRRVKVTAQARALIGLIHATDSLSITGALTVIITGLYMALTAWSLLTGWIAVALGSLIVFIPLLIRGIIEPRMRSIVTLAKEAPDGPLPAELQRRIDDPLLAMGMQTSAALIIGIVFLMTNKPTLFVSLLVIAASLLVGLVSGLPRWRAKHMRSA